MHYLKHALILLSLTFLASCGGVKTQPKPPAPASKAPTVQAPSPVPPSISAPPSTTTPAPTSAQETPKSGGYYLDDGPGDNPPSQINTIPNAKPIYEPYFARSNRPYTALGQRYIPMTRYQPYKKHGVASWYGKRFHGRQTSSGEVYDMYAMTAAHPILPIPSYVKVTNVNNGAEVIVRVNDRGPFKHSRLIDLSYVAAHKLGIVNAGSGKVEVELINPEQVSSAPTAPRHSVSNAMLPGHQSILNTASQASPQTIAGQYYVQAGAFKLEANAIQLQQTILQQNLPSIDAGQNISMVTVYNNGLHKVRLGPYATQHAADLAASEIRKTHNLSAIVKQE